MQHAWAEIEHDIQYKASYAVPLEIRRRFSTLAGLLEIADREFQAIQDTDAELRKVAADHLRKGEASEVPITASSLKTYLDQRFGPDARHKDFSYEWITRLVLDLGFTTFGQIDDTIKGYDPDQLTDIIYDHRQSQITRFQLTLLAAMKDEYIARHPLHVHDWFVQSCHLRLRELFPDYDTKTAHPRTEDTSPQS